MKYNWKLVVLCLTIVVSVSGCAEEHRGIMENNIYYSNNDPNLQIRMRDQVEYRKGAPGKYQHQFLDKENHRLVYIHYTLHEADESLVDYYLNPDHWIYTTIHNGIEIERFEMNLVGEKWYARDLVAHESTMSCHMIRDLGLFTDRHDVLKVLYVRQMPPYICKEWKSVESLSQSQQQLLSEFRDGFSEDVKMTNYTKN